MYWGSCAFKTKPLIGSKLKSDLSNSKCNYKAVNGAVCTIECLVRTTQALQHNSDVPVRQADWHDQHWLTQLNAQSPWLDHLTQDVFPAGTMRARFGLEFFKPLQALVAGRMGAAMNLLACLFTANKFVQCDQGRVGWNGLPLAHDALRVNNFTGQHGATVHGKLQNMHQLFAAVHFHVGARRHKEGAALSLLRRSVIEQAPERTNGAISFDGAVVDINNAGIGGRSPFAIRHWQYVASKAPSKRFQQQCQF